MGVTGMRKSASFYFLKRNPLSRLVGIDINSGGEWQTFWALRPMNDWEWNGWSSIIQWVKRMPSSLLSTSLSQRRPFVSDSSALRALSTMSRAWLINPKHPAIRETGR